MTTTTFAPAGTTMNGTARKTCVFASDSGSQIAWLADALQHFGAVEPAAMTLQALEERIAASQPRALFIDFSTRNAATAAALLRDIRRAWPTLAIVGAGAGSDPATMLAGLRAGVDDFIDTAAPPREAAATLVALLERRSAQHQPVRGRTVALLGARAGLGTTTLAASLALLMQESTSGAALLDLGLPARDGLLYLDTQSSFSFVDGVHNLRRIDQTLVHTAVAHHADGAAVLPLPASLAQIREISHADSAALVRRLADYFDYQFIDLGGFTAADFIARTVGEADRIWVVCDQSIGGIISTSNLLGELETRGVDLQRLSLVVNMIDATTSLAARDIAARLQLPLAHVLPMRRSALLAAAARGEMLVTTARNDPYAQAVQAMVNALHREFPRPRDSAGCSQPAPVHASTATSWNGFMTRLGARIGRSSVADRRPKEN